MELKPVGPRGRPGPGSAAGAHSSLIATRPARIRCGGQGFAGRKSLAERRLGTRGLARVQQAGSGHFHKKAATQLEAEALPGLPAPTAGGCPTSAPLEPRFRQAPRCGLTLLRRGFPHCPTGDPFLVWREWTYRTG